MRGELQRIINYAKGLGLTVEIRPYRPGGAGGEYIDADKIIRVYRGRHDSDTDVILILLHELGHHLDFIYKGKRDAKTLEAALIREDDRRPGDPPIARTYRKYIRDCEYAGTEFMPQIATELDLRVPMWKVLAERDLDRWLADEYLRRGDDPLRCEIKDKRRELRAKYRERK